MNLNNSGKGREKDYKAVEEKFLLAGMGGGILGWEEAGVVKEGVPRERDVAPEESEGVLEDTEDILEGAGGVGIVVPLWRRLRGATAGGADDLPSLPFKRLSFPFFVLSEVCPGMVDEFWAWSCLPSFPFSRLCPVSLFCW